MKRDFRLPGGAQVHADGTVSFRLWAPAAPAVAVCIDGQTPLAMTAEEDGWYAVRTDRAQPGSLYTYQIDGQQVPDPYSRYNPGGVHGPSQVWDAQRFDWQDGGWSGRPWQETVLYELHVGTFTEAGTLVAAIDRLDYLVKLGITAIELMPLAATPGNRNWGYDGVLPFAIAAQYGTPDDLKRLVQAAHQKGLMVFLDVVYNHFGPEGNYLHQYAPAFFTDRHHTPWGAGLNFDGPDSGPVRAFFISNALFWLEEYHLDGLRLDAVHAILDDSRTHILAEIASQVRSGPGRQRQVHLVLENDENAARYLKRDAEGNPQLYDAQWNDDFHHVLQVLLTGETDGYYVDYASRPFWQLGRCLTAGFAYQRDPSPYRDGQLRGEPTGGLPLCAFVNFLQNHDQVGNRAFGDRLSSLASAAALRAGVALLLLAPSVPLLFMGEEFASESPFLFFSDFGPELAAAVTAGRRREFARFQQFADPAARSLIPDPGALATFESSKLDWQQLQQPPHAAWHAYYSQLLALRAQRLLPAIGQGAAQSTAFTVLAEQGVSVQWQFENARLALLANLSGQPLPAVTAKRCAPLFSTHPLAESVPGRCSLPPWHVSWFLDED